MYLNSFSVVETYFFIFIGMLKKGNVKGHHNSNVDIWLNQSIENLNKKGNKVFLELDSRRLLEALIFVSPFIS